MHINLSNSDINGSDYNPVGQQYRKGRFNSYRLPSV